jgi:hypothetical protein
MARLPIAASDAGLIPHTLQPISSSRSQICTLDEYSINRRWWKGNPQPIARFSYQLRIAISPQHFAEQRDV